MAYEEFIAVLSDLSKVFVHLHRVEQTKLTAALDNNIELLQNCMTKEQAASMELKGLERKRMQLQASLGFADLSFQEIVERAEPEYVFELNTAVKLLGDSIREFEAISNEAGTVIEMNLANLNMLLSQRYLDSQQGVNKGGSNGKFTGLKV